MIQKIKSIINQGETRSHLVKTFFIYGFISLSIIILRVLIARFYGQEELGIFTYLFSLVSLIYLFSSLSLPDALTQVIIKQPHLLKQALLRVVWQIIPPTIIFTLLALFITDIININPEMENFTAAVALYIITYTIHYLTYSILRGFKKFAAASWFSLLNRTLAIVFLIVMFWFSFSFSAVLLSMSAALLIAGVLAIPSIIKAMKEKKQDSIGQMTPPEQEHTQKKESFMETLHSKDFFHITLALFLMQVSIYTLRFVDALVINYLADFNSLGLYSAHSSIINVIRLIGYVLPMVVVPMAAVNRYKLRTSFKKIMILLVPFSSVVLIGNYLLIPWLYGPEYQTTYLPVALVISSMMLNIYSYFNSIFVGENKHSSFFIRILWIDFAISMILNTALNFLFVYYWGIIGAPIAVSLVLIIKIALNLYGIKMLRGRNAPIAETPVLETI